MGYQWHYGAPVRGKRDKKLISLIFTCGEYNDGFSITLNTLRTYCIQASFFLTGDFLRNPENLHGINEIVSNGYYLGPHSDKHLQYCSWNNRGNTTVSREEFVFDINSNIKEIERFGVVKTGITWWIPPYEWYNEEIVEWSNAMGLRLFSYSPGTLSQADYTEDKARNYRSSDEIFKSIIDFDTEEKDGLNGFLMLTHVGVGNGRSDKFYNHFPVLIKELLKRGYSFDRVDNALSGIPIRPHKA